MIKGDRMKNGEKKSVPMSHRVLAAVLAGMMIFVAVAGVLGYIIGVMI